METQRRLAESMLFRPVLCPQCGKQVTALALVDHQVAEHDLVRRQEPPGADAARGAAQVRVRWAA